MALLDSFQPVLGDRSIAFLSLLFGGLGSLPGNPGILASLFKTFNSIVLVVGLFVVVYTVIVGLITTAHEGEFLGKKFHNLWTPVRMVIGIASLVPTSVGYSGLQVIIMWVFIQGIGAADTLWTSALNYVQQYGLYGKMTATPLTLQSNINEQLKALFKGLVCTASANLSSNDFKHDWWGGGGVDPDSFIGYKINQDASTTTPAKGPIATENCSESRGNCTLSFNTPSCGTLTYSNPKVGDEGTKQVNKAQRDVILGSDVIATRNQEENGKDLSITLSVSDNNPISIIDQLYYLAYLFAISDQQYVKFYVNSSQNPDNDDPHLLMNDNIGAGKWGWMEDYCAAQTPHSITPCCRITPFSRCWLASLKPGSFKKDFPSPLMNPLTDTSSKAAEIYFQYNVKPNTINNPTFAALGLRNKDGVTFFQTIFQKLSSNYVAALAAKTPTPPPPTDPALRDASIRGWLFAGGFYYNIANYNAIGSNQVNPKFDFTAVNPLNNDPDKASNYRNNMTAIGDFLSGSGGATTSPYGTAVEGLQQQTLALFMKNLTGAGGTSDLDNLGGSYVNPLMKMQSFGQQLLLTVEVTWPIIMAIDLTLTALSIAFSINIAGFGVPLYVFLQAIHAFTLPMLYGLFTVLTGIGGLLAVYVPLIPYIIFTMAAMGWFISIVEAMIAAPLIAVGILAPSAQHHEILGKAEGALMTIFSIFMKPSLMIFGLIVAMLLATIGVGLVNATFQQLANTIVQHQEYAGGLTKQTYMDALELLFFMSAYLFLVIAVLNKCFSVIATLPGKVMSYIGGQTEGAESDALGDVKGGISAAGAGAGGGMSGAGGLVSKGAEKWEKDKEHAGGTQTADSQHAKKEGEGDDTESGGKESGGKESGGVGKK